jgi:heat shock protein HtpX
MTTYDFIKANKRRTVWLIAVFSALVVGLGYAVDRLYGGGGTILLFAALYSVATSLYGFYRGDRMALSTSGARPVTVQSHPYVVRMIENLCIATGTPMPNVYVIDDPSINAFATGRDPQHASLAVTTGAIAKLENEELEGVLAHELSHIRNYDIRVMTLVIVLVGTIALISDIVLRMMWHRGGDRDRNVHPAVMVIGLILIVLSPVIAQIISLAVSRRREYLADASAALITRFPDGLARALAKIEREARPMQHSSAATAHLFIANPFSGKALSALFSTHPPIEKRIAKLREMGSLNGQP